MIDGLVVAIVQQAPIFLDLTASTALAEQIILRHARDGAGLVVFPETWLPGYPIWVDEAADGSRWSIPAPTRCSPTYSRMPRRWTAPKSPQ